MGEDWRVCIAWDDLPDLMSEQRLTRELSSRLGYEIRVSWGNRETFWYAPSAGSADEIAQVAREVLARYDARAPVLEPAGPGLAGRDG